MSHSLVDVPAPMSNAAMLQRSEASIITVIEIITNRMLSWVSWVFLICLTVLSCVETTDDRGTWITRAGYAKSVTNAIPNSSTINIGCSRAYSCCCASSRVSYLECLKWRENSWKMPWLLKYFALHWSQIWSCKYLRSICRLCRCRDPQMVLR